jgi:proline dehydrogenase
MLRSAILAAARSKRLQRVVSGAPVSRDVVSRFVGGTDTASVVAATAALVDQGLLVCLDYLGEDTTDARQAAATVTAYLELLSALRLAGLTRRLGPLTTSVDVSVTLSAIGLALPGEGTRIATESARQICTAAAAVGASVTLDLENHTTTDQTLSILTQLRADFPNLGVVLPACLRRTESDCRALAVASSRVRLGKGAPDEPDSLAFGTKDEVDRSYARCMNILLAGDGYPIWATHDPRLIEIAAYRASFYGKDASAWEYQLRYGVRPHEQQRLADAGHHVRVYLPYGSQWYGYLMRRLAQRPANLSFLARSLVKKG